MTTPELLLFFSRWIEKETGIIYDENNMYQLKDRLEQLAHLYSLKSPQELLIKAKDGISGEFRQHLIDISTNNETSFFRDQRFFESLQKLILPRIMMERGGLGDLKVWSVASSTGQEPYSMAIILTELASPNQHAPAKILATDISEKVLAKAKTGVFSELEIMRGLSQEHRARYFTLDAQRVWTLNSKIRDLVEFQKLNLLQPFSLKKSFDLILCRNVLIYQRVEAKIEIIKKISAHLNPGGIFLMGAGESLIGLSSDFEQSLVDGVAVYRRKLSVAKAA